MTLPLAALLVAIVSQDQTPMLASPEPRAPRQTVLWQGDWLEVRGQRRDYLKVYDHRHERPGYIHRSQVRSYELGAAAAPQLRAIVDFLRDGVGSEALGIGYVALYLKAAPASQVDSHILDALGTMAERLAWRASRSASPRDQKTLAGHLEVAASYGVRFKSFEEEGGRTRLCYDNDAFRRVLTFAASADEKARAVLSLTSMTCLKPGLGPAELRTLYQWYLTLLDRSDPVAVPAYLGNRLRIRRAAVTASFAFELARLGQAEAARRMSETALRSYLRIDRSQLGVYDGLLYDRAALFVAASRWARETAQPSGGNGRVRVELSPARPGETCVRLRERESKKQAKQSSLLERCTYGLPWLASVRHSPNGRQLTMAVQHLPGWLELWLMRRDGKGQWTVDVLVPATEEPKLGYVELAGWVPGGDNLLLVRESIGERGLQRRFQLLKASTLEVSRESFGPERLQVFRRWRSPEWKQTTVALRTL